MPTRVLVTGGHGFLGRRIVEKLRKAGFNVTAPTHAQYDLDERPIPHLFDIMVHAAALVGGIGFVQKQPARIFETNARIHLGALAQAKASGVSTFIGIGSACAYPELFHGALEEGSFSMGPPHPSVFSYGMSKRVLEAGQQCWAGERPARSAHLVLANLAGPGDTTPDDRAHGATAIARKIARAMVRGEPAVPIWGTGRATREWLHVDDAARAVVLACERVPIWDAGRHEVVNVGTGRSNEVAEFVAEAADAVGYRGEIDWQADAPEGVRQKVLDVMKAAELFDFTAHRTFSDTVRETVFSEYDRASGGVP